MLHCHTVNVWVLSQSAWLLGQFDLHWLSTVSYSYCKLPKLLSIKAVFNACSTSMILVIEQWWVLCILSIVDNTINRHDLQSILYTLLICPICYRWMKRFMVNGGSIFEMFFYQHLRCYIDVMEIMQRCNVKKSCSTTTTVTTTVSITKSWHSELWAFIIIIIFIMLRWICKPSWNKSKLRCVWSIWLRPIFHVINC